MQNDLQETNMSYKEIIEAALNFLVIDHGFTYEYNTPNGILNIKIKLDVLYIINGFNLKNMSFQ